jgi:hypothetical protein
MWACLLTIVMAGGCAETNAVVGGTCAATYTECNLRCVDLMTDPLNCGQCGRQCSPCVNGRCPSEIDGSLDADSTLDGTPFDGFTEDGRARDGEAGDAPDALVSDASDGGDGSDVACIPPFNTPAQCGDCFTQCVAPNTRCLAVDGGFACGPPCTLPEIECDLQCVDPRTDPMHCGACNVVCPSQLCVNRVCSGSTAGHVVAIGHDYFTTQAGTAQARVLSNAVFIPARNPLRVLAYERYAQTQSVNNVMAILSGVATSIGRTLDVQRTSLDTDIPTRLNTTNFAVLLVCDQATANAGDLATLGTSWQSTLNTFTQGGGVVVFLNGGAGTTREMPQLITATGLLTISAQTSVQPGTALNVALPADVVGSNVLSPYGAGNRTVRMVTTAPASTWVVVEPNANEPVVIHRTVP